MNITELSFIASSVETIANIEELSDKRKIEEILKLFEKYKKEGLVKSN